MKKKKKGGEDREKTRGREEWLLGQRQDISLSHIHAHTHTHSRKIQQKKTNAIIHMGICGESSFLLSVSLSLSSLLPYKSSYSKNI